MKKVNACYSGLCVIVDNSEKRNKNGNTQITTHREDY